MITLMIKMMKVILRMKDGDSDDNYDKGGVGLATESFIGDRDFMI